MKLAAVSELPVSVCQFREKDDREVDFILQGPGGAVVGIEVKATTSPGADSAKHLRWLRERLGERFTAGVAAFGGERGEGRELRVWD